MCIAVCIRAVYYEVEVCLDVASHCAWMPVGGWPRLTEQAPSLSVLTSSALLLVLNSPVAHDVLLPHCAALLHHGGSGTVAAALRCGVPQLVCPLHFDQHSWVSGPDPGVDLWGASVKAGWLPSLSAWGRLQVARTGSTDLLRAAGAAVAAVPAGTPLLFQLVVRAALVAFLVQACQNATKPNNRHYGPMYAAG